ncbi:DUF6783 domain-containing protein [Dysosmobacter sp.]
MRRKFPTKYGEHLTESNFQTRSRRMINIIQEKGWEKGDEPEKTRI